MEKHVIPSIGGNTCTYQLRKQGSSGASIQFFTLRYNLRCQLLTQTFFLLLQKLFFCKKKLEMLRINLWKGKFWPLKPSFRGPQYSKLIILVKSEESAVSTGEIKGYTWRSSAVKDVPDSYFKLKQNFKLQWLNPSWKIVNHEYSDARAALCGAIAHDFRGLTALCVSKGLVYKLFFCDKENRRDVKH